MEPVDLLQNRHILPAKAIPAPKPRLQADVWNNANCSPDIFRCTLTKVNIFFFVFCLLYRKDSKGSDIRIHPNTVMICLLTSPVVYWGIEVHLAIVFFSVQAKLWDKF